MNPKKTYLTFLFLFFYCRIISQPNIPKFVSIGASNSNERPAAIYVKSDGSYFLGGMKNDSAFVMYLNSTDSIIWAKTFKYANYPCYTNYLGMTSDGYLIGTGMSRNGSLVYSCYFKINPNNGNFIWNRFCNGNTLYHIRVIEKNVNEYIYAQTGYPSASGGTSADYKITIVSASTGSILYQPNAMGFQPYLSSIDDFQACTDRHPVDGSFFGSGRSYIQGAIDKMRSLLVKYDANGNPIWFKYVHKPSSETSRMYCRDLIYVSQTQILMMYFSDDNCTGACTDYYPGLILLDTAGNVIWDKRYYIPASNSEWNEKIEIIGNRIYMSGYTNAVTPNNGNIFILKTDMNGNPLACNQYGSSILNEREFINDVANGGFSRNNLFYFTYAAEDPNTGLSDINILKLDSSLQVSCYPATPLAVGFP